MLLDDQIDEHVEEERAAKGERMEKEKRLAHAGEELRNLALQRVIRDEGEVVGNIADEDSGKGGCSAGPGSRV